MKIGRGVRVLPGVCLSLPLLCFGCSNSAVNETGSGVTQATNGSAEVKPSEPPPSTYKEYYEQQQKLNPTPAKKGGAATKSGTK